jgi:hypothetical protein
MLIAAADAAAIISSPLPLFRYDIIDTLIDFHAMPLRHFHILFALR